MDQGRPSLRLLAALLVVALPPLIAFAAINVFAGDWLLQRGFGAGTQLLIGTLVTVVWATLVAGFASRLAQGEARSLLDLVERGTPGQGEQPEALTAAQRRLAATLEERNRQIAELAEVARRAPIAEDAVAVARSMAAAARSLTGDPTWVLVVLRAGGTAALPLGAYGPDPDEGVEPLGEVHRWASTLELPGDGSSSTGGARHAIGPWGAFVIVDVAAGEDLSAILLAPWEGRAAPSPVELRLFGLLGQHAATAIEHALLYTRLRAQTDELNRMAAVQTDFLRGITHDLQTPLTSIRALAAELRDAGCLSEAGRADLDTIAHQADRLRRMVGQLLAVSRLEVGALTPRQEVFRVEPILRRTWDALRADRVLEVAFEGEAHLAVGDPDRFEQVLWAVLDNAVKYSPAGSRISIQVGSRPMAGGLEAVLTVSDEGMGMDEATRERAFEQFYRSADARRLAPDGSGVGLYAGRGLLRAMGGDMTLESRLGGGTAVTITLPAERASEEPVPGEEAAARG